MLYAVSLALIGIEIICLIKSYRYFGKGMFIFYTIISNFLAMLSSLCLLIFPGSPFTAAFRYLSVCMMTMTCLVVIFVLVPMSGDLKGELFSGTQFFYHLLCPIMTLLCYILWEEHYGAWQLPALGTTLYGFVMIYLNYAGKADGPYPFLRVRQQSKAVTAMWIGVMFAAITAIALGIRAIAR